MLKFKFKKKNLENDHIKSDTVLYVTFRVLVAAYKCDSLKSASGYLDKTNLLLVLVQVSVFCFIQGCALITKKYGHVKYHIHCVYVCYIHIIGHFIRCNLRERETKWGGGGLHNSQRNILALR